MHSLSPALSQLEVHNVGSRLVTYPTPFSTSYSLNCHFFLPVATEMHQLKLEAQ